MRVTSVVCDMCEEREAAEVPYSVAHKDDRVAAELCDVCADPLQAIIRKVKGLRAEPRPPVRRRKGATKYEVASMEEIEKLKKK